MYTIKGKKNFFRKIFVSINHNIKHSKTFPPLHNLQEKCLYWHKGEERKPWTVSWPHPTPPPFPALTFQYSGTSQQHPNFLNLETCVLSELSLIWGMKLLTLDMLLALPMEPLFATNCHHYIACFWDSGLMRIKSLLDLAELSLCLILEGLGNPMKRFSSARKKSYWLPYPL